MSRRIKNFPGVQNSPPETRVTNARDAHHIHRTLEDTFETFPQTKKGFAGLSGVDEQAKLPGSLTASVAAFVADPELRRDFGAEPSSAIADLRRAEAAHLAGASPEEIAAAQRWVYQEIRSCARPGRLMLIRCCSR